MHPVNFVLPRSRKGRAVRPRHESVEQIVHNHFLTYSSSDHVCKQTLRSALLLLDQEPAFIVETGSSAWGTSSSLLFDSYVNTFGGQFESVDVRNEPGRRMQPLCTPRSTFWRSDSVKFLQTLVTRISHVDLVYLDSWDVNWDDPIPAAIHGLQEFLVIFPLLKKSGGVLLIDDTPRDVKSIEKVSEASAKSYWRFQEIYGFPPGKGSLIHEFLIKSRIGDLIHHDYQLLWSFK